MSNNALSLAEYKLEGGQVLTAETVKKYLVSGNGAITDQETLMFIELCKAQKLNPFIREAYLIKFGNSPANIVVGKDVFVKRAYRNPTFKGMKAGIVTVDKDNKMIEREGALKPPGEILIGGWCEVYTSDKEYPIKSTVSLEEYSKSQATWKQMPMVMIRKCAIVTALREAFPEDLQGMYDSDEIKHLPNSEELPQKPVNPGGATKQQKNKIMALAAQKDLYNFEDKKNTSKLEDFCNSNGFNLKELKFEEVDELLGILAKYEPRKEEEIIQDVEFTDIDDVESPFDSAEQGSLL